TVLIPCKDEMQNIEACIASAQAIADEILIADSGSTDGTLELLRHRSDVRIIEREYRCWSDFNNWAIPQASHEWVLLVDADERVSPELAEEIRRLKETELASTSFDAFSMVRRNFFHKQPVRTWGRHTDSVKRLFRRTCRWTKRRTHSTLEVSDSKTRFLKTAFTMERRRTLGPRPTSHGLASRRPSRGSLHPRLLFARWLPGWQGGADHRWHGGLHGLREVRHALGKAATSRFDRELRSVSVCNQSARRSSQSRVIVLDVAVVSATRMPTSRPSLAG
ncbi:MAG: family 2 glycosyl transferase, partial [Planctomycetota bacterium]